MEVFFVKVLKMKKFNISTFEKLVYKFIMLNDLKIYKYIRKYY